MTEGRPHEGWRRRVRGLAVLLSAVPLAVVLAEGPHGENVHRPDADCTRCHTADRAMLDRDPPAARGLLAADLEERCILCHGDQGPSHHTGIQPRKPVPDTLPLSVEGLITCATCHFVPLDDPSHRSGVQALRSAGSSQARTRTSICCVAPG